MGEKTRCYIALGSNMGNAKANIENALELMGKVRGISVRAIAPLYRTAPVGYKDQDYFVNTVAEIDTVLNPKELLKKLQGIENHLGRVRVIRWGPRTIDLDIILYGNLIIDEPELIIPHPRMSERAFVVVPLADLCPDLLINGKSASDLAMQLADKQEIQIYRP